MLLIPLSGILIAGAITTIVVDYAKNLNAKNVIISLPVQLSALFLLLIALLLLIPLYLIPYINSKIIKHKKEKNKPINLLTKAHNNKLKKNIKKLSIIEKYILSQYYIKPDKKSSIFSEYSKDIDIINSLCEKSILYKSSNEDFSNLNLKLRERTFLINEWANNYFKKHSRILK